MSAGAYVLPGHTLDAASLPSSSKTALKLGPGLKHTPPSTITSCVAGQIFTDHRKNAVWVESSTGRYIPSTGDLVIATVARSNADYFFATLSDFTSPANLPILAFESATKKYRPQLQQGSVVYARVTLANKHMEPELECFTASTGKADGLGELKGGMVFPISLIMARRMMMPKPAEQAGLVLLDALGEAGLSFEMAVGRNGKVWIDSGSIRQTLAICKAIQDTDIRRLSLDEQRKLAKKIVRDV